MRKTGERFTCQRNQIGQIIILLIVRYLSATRHVTRCVSTSALQPPRPHGLPSPPAPLLSATSFRLRPPPYMTTCAVAAAACGPGAKMSLAYATGPFSVPHGPAGAPRTTGGQILYGALQSPPQNSPWSSLKSAPTRCEPIPAFPLLPGLSTCPAWPSAASAASRCKPFSPNRLTPASCDSGSWSGTMASGAREQEASCDAFVLSRRLPLPIRP